MLLAVQQLLQHMQLVAQQLQHHTLVDLHMAQQQLHMLVAQLLPQHTQLPQQLLLLTQSVAQHTLPEALMVLDMLLLAQLDTLLVLQDT